MVLLTTWFTKLLLQASGVRGGYAQTSASVQVPNCITLIGIHPLLGPPPLPY